MAHGGIKKKFMDVACYVEDWMEQEEIRKENVKQKKKNAVHFGSSYDSYIETLPVCKRITKEEFLEMYSVIRDENMPEYKKAQLKNIIVERNLRLVVKIALQIYTSFPYVDIMDLIQEGNIGLMQAVEKYDPNVAEFSTYARQWIYRNMQRFIDDNKTLIHHPDKVQEWLSKIKRAAKDLYAENQKKPTVEEICERTKISLKHYEEATKNSMNHVSLDLPYNNRDNYSDFETIGSCLVDTGFGTDVLAEHAMVDNLIRRKLREDLSPREELVIRYLYGIDAPQKSSAEIAEMIGITKVAVSQAKSRALNKLASEDVYVLFNSYE